jgi:hypothetical protein
MLNYRRLPEQSRTVRHGHGCDAIDPEETFFDADLIVGSWPIHNHCLLREAVEAG